MNPAANPPHYPFQDDPFDWHPYANIFPLMEDEDLEKLANDIEANGQLNPVQIYGGLILDGRNRYKAIEIINHRRLVEGKSLMMLSYGTFEKDVDPENDNKALSYVRSHNVTRRNLKPSQLHAIGVEIEAHYADIAKREIEWKKQKADQEISVVNSQPGSMENKSAYKAAKDIGTGQQGINRAKAVKEADPELFNKLHKGEISTNAAYNQVKGYTKKEPEAPIEEESDSQTLEVTSEEIIISFVSNIESLFLDEIQYCLNEIHNRRRDAVKEFIANLKITDPLLFN